VPQVSVVIPVRNREWCIARAIQSALTQTRPPAEVIVVDDGSTDGTTAAVRQFGPRVRLLHQSASGPYAARNLAIRAARTPLIAFLDSDDAWRPRKLERQVPAFDDASVGVVFGNSAIVRWRNGEYIPAGTTFGRTPPGMATQRDFTRGNFVSFSTAVVRRECFEACGEFDERLAADYLAFFRIARRYRLSFVPEVVNDYTLHDSNISGDQETSLRARWELFADELERAASDAERRLIEHILFNHRLHLRLVALRGRARSASVPDAVGPWRWRWAVTFLLAEARAHLNRIRPIRRRAAE
jgi:glycosyltransferase involved in cell wall biosynthesis